MSNNRNERLAEIDAQIASIQHTLQTTEKANPRRGGFIPRFFFENQLQKLNEEKQTILVETMAPEKMEKRP